MQVDFKIPGEPMAKQRPVVTKAGHTYTPERTILYENLVKWCFIEANKEKVFWDNEPLSVDIKAYFKIPKSYSKKRAMNCISGKISPSTKDCDNIAKIICDALNSIAYTDDKHINRLCVIKMWTFEEPQTLVSLKSNSKEEVD